MTADNDIHAASQAADQEPRTYSSLEALPHLSRQIGTYIAPWTVTVGLEGHKFTTTNKRNHQLITLTALEKRRSASPSAHLLPQGFTDEPSIPP